MSPQKSAKSLITKLKKLFKDNSEAIETLEELSIMAKNLSDKDESKQSFDNVEDMPIPRDVSSVEGYALFSDGACRGNPGPGAYGALAQLANGQKLFEASGVELRTTNNKMELLGAIVALEKLKSCWDEGDLPPKEVFLYSDSKYVVDGIQKWVPGWKKRGWKKADGKTPENVDLWQRLDDISATYIGLNFRWVKGHAGHPQNEFCDQLANRSLDESGF